MIDSIQQILKLDEFQLAAVTAPRGTLAILAGAGSGKTNTLIGRILHYVTNHQVSADSILALTYAVKAAEELKSRLLLTAEELALKNFNPKISTFHAAAYSQLKYFWPRFFSKQNWQLVSSNFRYLYRAINSLQIGLSSEEMKELSTEISWAKSSLISPETYPSEVKKLDRIVNLDIEEVSKIYRKYEQLKQIGSPNIIFDYEDLLIYANLLFQEYPAARKIFFERYRVFFVDEFQDISPAQYQLLRTWLTGGEDLTVVGDINQAIFSFTGGSSKYLQDFTKFFPKADIYNLKHNYRSDGYLVAAANKLIQTSYQQKPTKEAVHNIQIKELQTLKSEVNFVINSLKKLIAQNVDLRDIAILYRINSQAEPFEIELIKNNIPYKIRGESSFFEKKEIKSVLKVIYDYFKGKKLLKPSVEQLDNCFEKFGLLDLVSKEEHKVDNHMIRQLYEICKTIIEDRPIGFTDFLETSIATKYVAADNPSLLTLSTIHAAKGKEWQYVFLVNVIDTLYPFHKLDSISPQQLEEEQRLFYVAITRCINYLTISYYNYRNDKRRLAYKKSRYLQLL